ncbi:endonuclease/exonuclease/phosphatase family protein [Actibacterium pelagium]|nr:endonuclease/exonuclease/phosphatase family protein [Actibacterium pelagium]
MKLRVASYNIRKCVGLDLRRKPDRTLNVIAGLQSDIVVLQEADKRLGPRPSSIPVQHIEDRTGLRPLPLAANDVSVGWHGNAVLASPDVVVKKVDRLHLPGFEPRGAGIAEVEIGGQTIRIVATHLGLMRKHRAQQLHYLRQELEALPDLPTVIAGDMNEWSPNAGFEALGTGFTLHSPGRSFHASRPIAGLDRIGHCGSFSLYDAGVSETPEARRASDHLPVWADLTLN